MHHFDSTGKAYYQFIFDYHIYVSIFGSTAKVQISIIEIENYYILQLSSVDGPIAGLFKDTSIDSQELAATLLRSNSQLFEAEGILGTPHYRSEVKIPRHQLKDWLLSIRRAVSL